MSGPFLSVASFFPEFPLDLSKCLSNVKSNFGNYFLKLIFSKCQDSLTNQDVKDISKYLSKTIKVQDFVPYFVEECRQRFVSVEKSFATYFIHLLISDVIEGLDLTPKENQQLSVCKLEHFIESCLLKYVNPLDATVSSMKMCFYFKGFSDSSLDKVKEKYEICTTAKLSHLLRSILQYPETINQKQLEEMIVKIQVFIITTYQLGCPKDAVLLKQTRQSLNSVLGKGDLQKYVLKKRHNRHEYLRRLSATVGGILIFNSCNSQKEGNDSKVVRNIFSDLEMAQRNTKDSLDQGIKRASMNLHQGFYCLQNLMCINLSNQKVQFLAPISKMRQINKFIILYTLYKRYMEFIIPEFEKTERFIERGLKKFNCVLAKIKETIKFRSAIESELVFPHFVYLSDLWSTFLLYLNHLVEINKIIEKLDEFVNEKLEHYYNTLVKETLLYVKEKRDYAPFKFEELLPKKPSKNTTKYPYITDFCALTLILTKGLLLPSKVNKKLSTESDVQLGFANAELATYADRNFSNFVDTFNAVIIGSADLMLLFEADEMVIKQYFDLEKQKEAKSLSGHTQTEFNANHRSLTKTSWNIWDFHRETIHLANIRRKQTHSSQSAITYGRRNAQSQAYNTRDQ